MRVPTYERRRFRLRGWMIALVIVIIVLLFSLRGLAGFYVDALWFDSLGQGGTWGRLLAAKIVPAAVFTVIFFVIMIANLLIADRLAPPPARAGPDDPRRRDDLSLPAGDGSLHRSHPHRDRDLLRAHRGDRRVGAVA